MSAISKAGAGVFEEEGGGREEESGRVIRAIFDIQLRILDHEREEGGVG